MSYVPIFKTRFPAPSSAATVTSYSGMRDSSPYASASPGLEILRKDAVYVCCSVLAYHLTGSPAVKVSSTEAGRSRSVETLSVCVPMAGLKNCRSLISANPRARV